MNKTLIIPCLLLAAITYGQNNLNKQAKQIEEEGKLLYSSEVSSWHGTDIFVAQYKNLEKIGGYFSYTEEDTSRCIFFSKEETPEVLGTISFDSTHDPRTAVLNLTPRKLTPTETSLYEIRKLALKEINSDTIFKTYSNTNLNLIPLVKGDEKKVYVLTGPTQNGVIIFGNDYLLTFDKDNNLTSKKQLHRNIIPIYYGGEDEKNAETTMHNHSEETGHFITATDICTLMLYEKYANWKSHIVVSKKYMNTWNCETNKLFVLPMDVVKKIDKDQKKRKKKKNK